MKLNNVFDTRHYDIIEIKYVEQICKLLNKVKVQVCIKVKFRLNVEFETITEV